MGEYDVAGLCFESPDLHFAQVGASRVSDERGRGKRTIHRRGAGDAEQRGHRPAYAGSTPSADVRDRGDDRLNRNNRKRRARTVELMDVRVDVPPCPPRLRGENPLAETRRAVSYCSCNIRWAVRTTMSGTASTSARVVLKFTMQARST